MQPLSRGIAGLGTALVLFLITGCANMTHLTRVRSVPESGEDASVILIDAKQRAILTAKRSASEAGSDPKTVSKAESAGSDPRLVQCAEPSPDAISALAASSSTSLSVKDQVNLATNLALSEGVASIGLRTQSIQLMRDSMYRLCEGYLSGAIDPMGFETLHRRMQSSMVAILAIEQLTGVMRPPSVVLGAQSTSGAAEEVMKLTEMTAEARKTSAAAEKVSIDAAAKAKTATDALPPLQKDHDDKKKLADAAGATDAVRAAATDAKKKLDDGKAAETEAKSKSETAAKDLKDAQKQVEFLEKSLTNAQGGAAGTSTKAEIEAATKTASPSAVDSVATAVSKIVEDTLELSFTRELCTTLFLRNITTPVQPNEVSVLSGCVKYLTATADDLAASVKIQNARADIYSEVAAKLKIDSITAENAATVITALEAGMAANATSPPRTKPLAAQPTK